MNLSPKATEIQRGRKPPDRLAVLIAADDLGSQTGRSNLIFRYQVCDGDEAQRLEYVPAPLPLASTRAALK